MDGNNLTSMISERLFSDLEDRLRNDLMCRLDRLTQENIILSDRINMLEYQIEDLRSHI